SKEEIEKALKGFIGDYEQITPIYSVRKGAMKSGEIYSIELLDLQFTNFQRLKQEIIEKIKNVEGDFRQEEIIKQWQDVSVGACRGMSLRVTMSKGLYVRSLSQDIAKKLGTVGFVTSLIRTKNGTYSKKDCGTLSGYGN
ncbi:hypothetical protein OAL67_01380, partial [bacterium]|nr:hypothetical protein [bacterium]